ncbi:glutamine synthetase [Candidatus Anaplasma sp. TIGMIC]|uniref:glutamine synthetase n=1 Tax=Candidatus Anaplasma sp. TIGMIC TaxID=3020713 RepID=UPI0023308F9A|nr:glutamine synthetase [Candidatus Anaplasma sp. TIGMIC]MDB1135449.1 glutamine synthetase [Candidatus Anaplasma sp. TIGMIC]
MKCSSENLEPLVQSLMHGQYGSKHISVHAESCVGQYELCMGPDRDVPALLTNLTCVVKRMQDTAAAFNGMLDFSAKPHLDRPGSAFHIHVNLQDKNGTNLFFTDRPGKTMSETLTHSIGGLCAHIKRHMLFFAPNVQSYLRYTHHDIHTPTTVSWGGNNRSTTLRIPDTTLEPEKCRIEHRVAGADCNYVDATAAVLFGIARGLEQKLLPPAKTFGIASDTQYGLERLPLSLSEAIALHVPMEL